MSFANATRQNIRKQGTLAYESLMSKSIDISRVGFLSRIGIRFDGTVTAKHTTKTTFAKAAKAPFNLANRVRFTLNNGTALWDTTGYGAYLQNVMNKINYCLDSEDTSTVFKFGNTCSSTGAVNDLCFYLDLNMSLNDRDLIGLLLLQNSDVVATLSVDNSASSVLTTDTDIELTIAGSYHITIEYFDVPASTADYPVQSVVHQVIEEQTTINSTGQNTFKIPRGNVYTRIVNLIEINGTASTEDITRMALKYNVSAEPYSIDTKDQLYLQENRYGRSLPDGVLAWDFFHQGIPNMGTNRDFVDSSEITEFDQIFDVDSSATLGANNNRLCIIKDMLVEVSSSI